VIDSPLELREWLRHERWPPVSYDDAGRLYFETNPAVTIIL
jgi:hypothetical protein